MPLRERIKNVTKYDIKNNPPEQLTKTIKIPELKKPKLYPRETNYKH